MRVPTRTIGLTDTTLADGWHTVRLDCQSERLTWFMDGKWRLTRSQVP
jgi:hypothetical protein